MTVQVGDVERPRKFRLKPDPVEAMQWTPSDRSMQDVLSWLRDEGETFKTVGRQLWIEFSDGTGSMIVHPGDYVVRKTEGKRYFYAESAKSFDLKREEIAA